MRRHRLFLAVLMAAVAASALCAPVRADTEGGADAADARARLETQAARERGEVRALRHRVRRLDAAETVLRELLRIGHPFRPRRTMRMELRRSDARRRWYLRENRRLDRSTRSKQRETRRLRRSRRDG